MQQVIYDCSTGKTEIVEVEEIDFPVPTEQELKERYDSLVVQFIREKYTQDDEFSIIRKKMAQIDSLNEFETYNSFVEECKDRARIQVYGGVI